MRPTTSSRATTWSRVSTKGPLAPSWRMVIMVEAGAVLAARAARTMEKDRSSPSTPLVRTNTAAEASRDSATVTTTTRRPFFFRVENWKNSPVLKAMKARATSGRKSMPSITVWGTSPRQQGPKRMPERM